MKWIKTQEQSLPHLEKSILTIGNFDGVHLGHRTLLKKVISQAEYEKIPSVVCTFNPHPRVLLTPEAPVYRLFDFRDQAEVFESLGLDYLIEEKFTKDFSLMDPEEFLDLYVQRYFRPKHIVVGYDFGFGRLKSGNTELLSQYCMAQGIQLSVIPPFKLHDGVVSSSQIRLLLEGGHVEKANEYLGRQYYLRGPVRVGFKRGRGLGVPTANMSPDIQFIPRKGVYFTQTETESGNYHSITNIGFNPTFDSSQNYLKVETHLFNFDREIYGEQIKVNLLKFHRDEIKFNDIESLKNQIEDDKKQAKAFFVDNVTALNS